MLIQALKELKNDAFSNSFNKTSREEYVEGLANKHHLEKEKLCVYYFPIEFFKNAKSDKMSINPSNRTDAWDSSELEIVALYFEELKGKRDFNFISKQLSPVLNRTPSAIRKAYVDKACHLGTTSIVKQALEVFNWNNEILKEKQTELQQIAIDIDKKEVYSGSFIDKKPPESMLRFLDLTKNTPNFPVEQFFTILLPLLQQSENVALMEKNLKQLEEDNFGLNNKTEELLRSYSLLQLENTEIKKQNKKFRQKYKEIKEKHEHLENKFEIIHEENAMLKNHVKNTQNDVKEALKSLSSLDFCCDTVLNSLSKSKNKPKIRYNSASGLVE